MIPTELPIAVAVIIVVTSVALAIAVVIAVRTLARRPGVLREGPDDLAGAARIAVLDRWLAGVLLVWSGAALLVTLVLPTPPAFIVPVFIGGLVGLAYALVTRSETGRRLLAATPQSWLVGAQVYRSVGGVFLVAAAYDAVPSFFALPAGWGDLLVGISAVAVAGLWGAGARMARGATWTWNAVGLLDLVVAVGIGSSLLARPAAGLLGGSPYWLDRAATGFQPLDASIFPIAFPLALIPTFIVPLSILLHLLSLRKLVTDGRAAHRMPGTAVSHLPVATTGPVRG